MRTFTRMRQMISSYEDLRKKIESMESKYHKQFRIVFDAIKKLLREDPQPGRKIGF